MEMPCQSKIVDTPKISAKIELTRRDLTLTFGATGGLPDLHLTVVLMECELVVALLLIYQQHNIRSP